MTKSERLAAAAVIVEPAQRAARAAALAGVTARRTLGLHEAQAWSELSDGRRGLVVRHHPGHGALTTIELVVDSESEQAAVEAANAIYQELGPYLEQHHEEGSRPAD